MNDVQPKRALQINILGNKFLQFALSQIGAVKPQT